MNACDVKMNLGCGLAARPGEVNIDRRRLPGVDVVADCGRALPFVDGCAARLLAVDVFEHFANVVAAIDECRRVLVKDGALLLRGPLPDSENLWADVTHRRAFVERSFDHFDWSTEFGRKYRYGTAPWRIVRTWRQKTNIWFWMRAANA